MQTILNKQFGNAEAKHKFYCLFENNIPNSDSTNVYVSL